MIQNICRFVPYKSDGESIHVLHFVLYLEQKTDVPLKTEAYYKMCLVIDGSGSLCMADKEYTLRPGDLFFTFSAVPFAIRSGGTLRYYYIGFVGGRAYQLLDEMKISRKNCIFHQIDRLEQFWAEGFRMPDEVLSIIGESVMLYTFARLKEYLQCTDRPKAKKSSAAFLIKKYIDDNFSLPTLSAESISAELHYNKKYISAVFRSNFGISLIEYLNSLRIRNACLLMQQRYTSITDISVQCGFSDPQYFSRVFKMRIGVPPAQYIHDLDSDSSPKA